MPLDEEDRAPVKAYRAFLDGLGPDGRKDFVDAARRGEDWPQPTEPYLARHARKWLPGLKGPQYAQRAYDLKNAAESTSTPTSTPCIKTGVSPS